MKYIKIQFIFILFITVSFYSCDLYPDWNSYVEYSDTYPLNGEYYVRDFDFNQDTLVEDWYKIYIYNKANNSGADSVWVDNATGHPTGGSVSYNYKFKIKTKADMDNLSFNCVKAGTVSGSNINPVDSAVTVTITNSKVFVLSKDINDSTPDSIYFEFTFYDKYGNETGKFKTYGHRKTGWENPNFDDNM